MKFKGIEYADFLKLWPGFDKFPDYFRRPEGKKIYLRHDMDSQIQRSLSMAEYEAKQGIVATYFALSFTDYWHKPETFKLLREIQEMGHEIGWHQSLLADFIEGGINITWDLMDETTRAILRKFEREGINIRGTSPHGSNATAKYGLNSWQLWDHFEMPYRNYPTICLYDYYLTYEAMGVYRDNYLSDSGNEWHGDPGLISKIFRDSKDYILQINIHPQWWE
jgi:hypothetical protein